MVKSSYDTEGRFHLIIDRTIYDLVENDLYEEVRKCIKESVEQSGIKQKILDEVAKQLLSMESKSILATLIAEIVSETIKETIKELKDNGIL